MSCGRLPLIDVTVGRISDWSSRSSQIDVSHTLSYQMTIIILIILLLIPVQIIDHVRRSRRIAQITSRKTSTRHWRQFWLLTVHGHFHLCPGGGNVACSGSRRSSVIGFVKCLSGWFWLIWRNELRLCCLVIIL